MQRDCSKQSKRMRPRLAADTRFHLRHETYNLEAAGQICKLAGRRAGSTCSRSTTTWTRHVGDLAKPQKRAGMVERTGLNEAEFDSAWSSVRRPRA